MTIKNQTHYSDFFEHHPQPVLMLEAGTIVDCNQAARKLFRLNEEHVCAQTLEQFFDASGFCSKQWLQRHLDLEALKTPSGLIAPLAFTLPVTQAYPGTYQCHFQPSSTAAGVCYLFIHQGRDNTEQTDADAHELQLGSRQIKLSCDELIAFIRTLFMHFDVGIKVYELDSGNIVAANQSFLDMLGFNEAELLGRPVSSLMPDAEQARYRESLLGLRTRGYHDAYLQQLLDAEGNLHSVSLLGSILSELNLRPYVWSFVANLNPVEVQNEMLLKREQRLNFAQKQTKMGNWELDLVSNTLYWSDQVFRIFELDKTQYAPSYELFLQTIHPDDREAVNSAYQQSLTDKTSYSIRHRLRMPDGRIKYVYENCQTDFDDTGKPLLSLGTIQDITVAHQAQQELANLARIVQTSRDFIGMASPDGRIVFINEAGRKMINFPGNLATESWFIDDLYIESDRQRIKQEVIPGLLEQGEWKGELNMQVFGTDDIILSFCDSFRIDDPLSGQAMSLACVTQNITDKRAAETRLADYHNQLEKLVEKRTRELVTAREQAVSANRAKSEFLSRVSHELRTPLNAVLGFAQILSYELSPASPAQADHLQEILGAGQHLLDMINDILDLSEIEIGNIQLDYQPMGLPELLRSCRDAFSADHPESRPAIRMDNIPEEIVCTDQKRFLQIFNNVLSNSLRFSDKQAQIRISASISEQRRFEVRILNNRLSLNREQMDQAFLPFEQLSEVFDLVQGSGIGLALSKELVQCLGGEIWLEATSESGTTCVISLPCEKQPAPAHSLLATEDCNLSQASEFQQNAVYTLLYIEDNATNMQLMRRVLSRYPQFRLLEAGSASEGFALLETTLPDLILLDLSLPDRDGVWVFKALRNQSRTAAVPVIAVTANAMREDAKQYQALGFDDCYFKPLDYQTLIEGIERILSEHPGAPDTQVD
jgi:PAS domain S-box-containing protein